MKKLFLFLALVLAVGVLAISQVKSPTLKLYDAVQIGQEFRMPGASEAGEYMSCYQASSRVVDNFKSIYLDLTYNECVVIYTTNDTVTMVTYYRNFFLYPSRSTGYGTVKLAGKTSWLRK